MRGQRHSGPLRLPVCHLPQTAVLPRPSAQISKLLGWISALPAMAKATQVTLHHIVNNLCERRTLAHEGTATATASSPRKQRSLARTQMQTAGPARRQSARAGATCAPLNLARPVGQWCPACALCARSLSGASLGPDAVQGRRLSGLVLHGRDWDHRADRCQRPRRRWGHAQGLLARAWAA